MTKLSLMPIVLAVLALGTGACGKSGPVAHSATDGASGAGASGDLGSGALLNDRDGDEPANSGYRDADDGEIDAYGHAASAPEADTIASVVRAYYTAAASGDARRACALTYYLDAETLPEKYGEPPGPLWLKGARTCPALLARVFARYHKKLTVPLVVTAVRVNGVHVDALVGFKTLAAGYVKLRREGSAWKVDGLLATPLP
jgi:hypothetical protein